MKLQFDPQTTTKLKSLMDTNKLLIIDMEDGVGPFTNQLFENGIRYRILVIERDSLPTSFDEVADSNLGPVYFNSSTGIYLDEEMWTTYIPKYQISELWSQKALLESKLVIRQAVPQVAQVGITYI